MGETADKTESVEVKSKKPEKESRHLAPFTEMEHWFQEMFPRAMRPVDWEWPSLGHIPRPFEGKTPRVDIVDRENEVLVKAELPGVKKEDLEVTTTDNTVSIKGSSRYEHKEEKGDYHRSEMACGVFARTLTLPAEVIADKAEARFSDGLLELTLPKRQDKKGHRVEVK